MRKQTQTEYAYSYIRNKILDGSFKPAQKLNESQLSETIGVSRNTIKKAFLMLEKENLIQIEKNKGATIKSYTLQEILNYMEIRMVLEGIVIKSAVKNITQQQLNQLEKVFHTMGECIKWNKLEDYSKYNKYFHNIIYSASTNEQAIQIINIIKTQLNRFQFKTILVPGRNLQSYKEHENILLALSSRNEDEAVSAIQSHIVNISNVIKENYKLLVL